ncbi:MAG: hypothetical protein FWE93_05825 [Alphaproteobacteria bacterium]|nr:hypothetical protein [Alphaproteobacteria bacterium]
MRNFDTVCKGLAIASFAFALFFTTAAQAQLVIGTHNCYNTPVPCEASEWSSDQWADAGDACIRRAFGMSASGGIIDRNAGLDSSNKLTTMADAIERPEGAPLNVPSCSVIKTRSDTCAIRCVLLQY